MTDTAVLIPPQQLEQFLAEIFEAAGCSQPEAHRIARHLVKANLAGHDSHGAVRVVRYIPLQKDGLIHPDQQVEVAVDTPVIAVVDGKFGYGQTVAPQAVAIGIRKCQAMGLSAVALRNSGHVGRVADWAEMAAAEGLVSIHFVNAASSPIVAPFGSSDRRFSTAPFCMGVPVPGGAPLLLDFATSVVAEGKVLVASQGGRPIPADALIGPDGRLSDDATLLYGDYRTSGQRDVRNGAGALRAFGEHKGSGLALMCELMGGALSGGGCAKPGARFSNGMFSLYLDPAQIDPEDFFPAEVGRYLAYVKAARAAPPAQEILFPGEPEERTKAQRLASGIPVPAETWALIQATARSVGVEEARIPAMAAHR
jgi:uncharacterized oxidoreductase